MKTLEMNLIIEGRDLVKLLREYIKQMVSCTYSEEYIGKTLAYIFESLEKEKEN